MATGQMILGHDLMAVPALDLAPGPVLPGAPVPVPAPALADLVPAGIVPAGIVPVEFVRPGHLELAVTWRLGAMRLQGLCY